MRAVATAPKQELVPIDATASYAMGNHHTAVALWSSLKSLRIKFFHLVADSIDFQQRKSEPHTR